MSRRDMRSLFNNMEIQNQRRGGRAKNIKINKRFILPKSNIHYDMSLHITVEEYNKLS